MRGKHATRKIEHLVRRITPAHAGKTSSSLIRIFGGADHPRACGENYSKRLKISHRFGSPPRMRGKQNQQPGNLLNGRITPAHAGKTKYKRARGFLSSDHPRACGENRSKSVQRNAQSGSPPRMRGKQYLQYLNLEAARITPAHAGKTISRLFPTTHTTDHPRACGENRWSNILRLQDSGSPPRMRGKQKLPAPVFSCGRITPAHAGKTLLSWSMKRPASDHPRACGENLLADADTQANLGSPPRMRGKL